MVNYFLDSAGNLWRGPTHPEENLHYSVLTDGGWVLHQTDPDSGWRKLPGWEWWDGRVRACEECGHPMNAVGHCACD